MSIITVLFVREGKPVLQITDDLRLVGFDGTHYGFSPDWHNVFSYTGSFVGYFEEGILRDRDGYCVAYILQGNPTNIPMLPPTAIVPSSAIIGVEPMRPPTSLIPPRPISHPQWSSLTPFTLFSPT